MKKFNTTAICIPDNHYMVDISDKIIQIENLINEGAYFTINRSRQYGKTTTMFLLERKMKERYNVLFISFEGSGSNAFITDENFVRFFVKIVGRAMKHTNLTRESIDKWNDLNDMLSKDDAFDYLSDKITDLCEGSDREILIFIDEVDKTSDNQVFLHFLGMLRNKYLEQQMGKDTSFKSVILAGVYDIKNLKIKIRPDEEKKYNSPWNIAADFNVDMSFSPKEIATMLTEYEKDYHTGMNVEEISKEIYFYTNGYPYLVSWICKWIDEQGNKIWDKENIKRAEKMIHISDSTLLDDLSKNYYNNVELKNMIDNMLFEGQKYSFSQNDSIIKIGVLCGIFKNKNGSVEIANIIFENSLTELVISKNERERLISTPSKNQFIIDGKLDMQLVLTKFQEIMKTEYRKGDEKFVEHQGRLLFICFLKPIINGTGFYYVEPETRNNTRMDIVVTYGNVEYIVELKIWHGEQYRQSGIEQLERYLENRNNDTGYLLSFSFNKDKEYIKRWINSESGKNIFEVVV